MSIKPLLFAIVLLPIISSAQHWRVEVNAGVAIPADLNSYKPVRSISGNNSPYAPKNLPGDVGVVRSIRGLKLMRRDSAIEYGISVNFFPVQFRSWGTDTSHYPTPQTINIEQSTYLASPAIPIRGFFNYCHHRSKSYAFIGLSGGVVIARGKEMQDVNQCLIYEAYAVYFHNAVGYTFGAQLGFRRTFGRFDSGVELAANFLHLSVKQGTSMTPYRYNIFYLPLQAYVGYSI